MASVVEQSMMAGAVMAGAAMAEGGLMLSEGDIPWIGGLNTHRTINRRVTKRTLTIFDWDDTFLPSTEMVQRGIGEIVNDPSLITPEFRAKLDAIEEQGLQLLERSVEHGPVIVVTNSVNGWVERSGAMFLPRVLDFFQQHSIRIISARSRYQEYCRPIEWKIHTFHDELKETFQTFEDVQLVVIGDGISEIVAARSLKQTYRNITVKTVKLAEMPTSRTMASQLDHIESSIDRIVEQRNSMELVL